MVDDGRQLCDDELLGRVVLEDGNAALLLLTSLEAANVGLPPIAESFFTPEVYEEV